MTDFAIDIVNTVYDTLKIDSIDKAVGDFLKIHTTINKLVLLANHFFRAASMYAMMLCMPFTAPINFVIGLVGSFFYKLTIEKKCVYKFALPSFFGAASFECFTKGQALTLMTNGISKGIFSTFLTGALYAVPLTFYLIYIVEVVNKPTCCRI